MLRYIRNIDWGALVGSGLGFGFLFSIVSSEACHPYTGANCTQAANNDNASDLSIGVIGQFFHHDPAAAITAIAAIFIAAFTIVLAVVTNRQARFTREAIQLARDEFYATHRPRIIVRAFQMWNSELTVGEAPNFIFVAHNIGDSPEKS